MKLTDADTGKALDVPETPKPDTEVIEMPAGLWGAVVGIIRALPGEAYRGTPGAAIQKLLNDLDQAKKR